MDADPGLAFEIWFAIERSGAKPPEDVDWSPDNLLTGAGQPQRVFAGIEDRLLRERAYTMVRERREDWPGLYRDAMSKEPDPRALDLLADGIAQGAPRELDRLIDTLLAQPHRYPAAFTWLVERAAVDEGLRARNPLRMLQQIFTALSRDEFATFRLRLLALAESGGTVPRLLGHLTEDQAAQAEDAIQRASSLEPYQREQLVNAIHLRFQGLRKETGPPPIYATQESVEAKRAELQQILSVDIPANRKAIEEARAMGDLRENFEYKSARQRHEYLNARAAALNGELNRDRGSSRPPAPIPTFRGAHRHPCRPRRRRRPADDDHPRPLGEQARGGRDLLRVRPRQGAPRPQARGIGEPRRRELDDREDRAVPVGVRTVPLSRLRERGQG